METLRNLHERPLIMAIRRGLVMATPLLLIGSFALVLNNLPFQFYRNFIANFGGGFLSTFFVQINQISFGILSLFSVFSISISYAQIKSYRTDAMAGAVFASLGSYAIFIGLFPTHEEFEFTVNSLGAHGLFTAIFCAIGASALFFKLSQYDRFAIRFYTVGADSDFNYAIAVIFPVAVVLILAYILNQAIIAVFHVSGFEALFHDLLEQFFSGIKSNTLAALVFVFVSGLLWFFGIHGTNVLESVARGIFYGEQAVGIINKSFLDIFVFMGGSGATISLLVAILLFAKQKNNRKLGKLSIIPMLFNINELMVFGLPIIYNPYLFIPFMVVPLVNVGISYLGVASGIVPMPVDNTVEWVTPVIFGGYQATGSLMGSLLQVVNIAVGVLIYRFFFLRYERSTDLSMKKNLERLIDLVRLSESRGEQVTLLDQKGNVGATARMLAEDLRYTMRDNSEKALQLYYQPQYDNLNKCVGAESLLRWDHPRFGMIYPPLVIMLAQEIKQLDEMERTIFRTACDDITEFKEVAGLDIGKVSVNVTAVSLQKPEFSDFIKNLTVCCPAIVGTLDVELTEQMSFMLGDAVKEQMETIKKEGIMFAVDDFSMGHTSIKYLQSDLFDLVKLDGSIVADMMENPRSEEIISSILQLSKSMGFRVMAECVETEEQRDKLERLGCYLYQGYYFSRPLPKQGFIDRLKAEQGLA